MMTLDEAFKELNKINEAYEPETRVYGTIWVFDNDWKKFMKLMEKEGKRVEIINNDYTDEVQFRIVDSINVDAFEKILKKIDYRDENLKYETVYHKV